jgi:polyisoprenoid-binding protein YceI
MKKLIRGASVGLAALAAACSPAAQTSAAPAIVEVEAAVPITITAPAGEYVSDPNHSSVNFSLQHLGLSAYNLKFKTFDATVTFDPANIAASKVTASIKAADILAGYPGDYVANHPGAKFKSWEDDLANSTNFLDAGAHPTITFVSTSVEPSGARTAKVTGDLTLKGVTRPVTLDVTFSGETDAHIFAKVPAIGFSAVGSLKRSEFGLDYLLPSIVGDDVNVQIEGDFIQKAAA